MTNPNTPRKPSEIRMRETISISRSSFVDWIRRCELARANTHTGDITIAREEVEGLESELRQYSGDGSLRDIEEILDSSDEG